MVPSEFLFVNLTSLGGPPTKRRKQEGDGPSPYVQIVADDEKVSERINNFIATKREQVNQSNRREFRSADPAVREGTGIFLKLFSLFSHLCENRCPNPQQRASNQDL